MSGELEFVAEQLELELVAEQLELEQLPLCGPLRAETDARHQPPRR